MSGFCNQRKLLMTNNNPTSREELEKPPSGFTTEQLNMRRKSEILQYKNNQTNSQNSQKSNFAQRVRGTYNRKRVCNNNTKVFTTSTSFTDVPGSSVLTRDPSVPLWKYNTNNINRYSSTDGISYEKEEKEWILFPIADLIIENNKRAALLTIYDDIKLNSYTYTFSTPIVSYFSGNNIPITCVGSQCNNQIVYISLDVYYNENIIYKGTTDVKPTISNNSFTIDQPAATTNNLFDFEHNFYNGIITFDNIVLPTSPGFSYEFKFNIFTILDINTDNAIEKNASIIKNKITTRFYANINNTLYNYSENVTSITQSSNDTNNIIINAV